MINNPNIVGELVFVKLKGESTPCYIPFSKDSGDKPVIATEQYVDKHCASIEDIIAALEERVKVLEGDKPSPTPKQEVEKTFTDLFKNGEKGFLYDFDYLPSLFADVDGKVKAEVGGEVRKVLDLSGNNLHLTYKGAAPKLAVNPTTGKHYLRFSGKEELTTTQSFTSDKLTLITHITRDFKSTKGYEMYFKVKDSDFELCCYERSKYTMRINSKVAQSVTLKPEVQHDTLVGSFDLKSKTVALKVGDIWLKSQGDVASIPDKTFSIGNSGGSNGVVGGMYAMIGVAEYWDNLSISPIEEVLKERAK